MKAVCKELFRAVHENCWLAVEYHNRKNEKTSYWIAVKDIFPRNKRLLCDGMHLGTYETAELNLSINRILSAKMIRGTYAEIPETLKSDIREHPEKYASVFSDTANLKILTYLAECNRLDQTPYKTDFVLVDRLDDEKIDHESIELSDAQFAQIIKGFVKDNQENSYEKLKLKQFGMNLLSVHTVKGVYLLAYLPLRLNVKKRTLGAFDEPVICTQQEVGGFRQSVRSFMDPSDLHLLENFRENAERIREAIAQYNPGILIDDMPYLLETARDFMIDLAGEYDGIFGMYNENNVTAPIQAFFGALTAHPRKSKAVPFALVDKKINLDQLLAMNHAMRYPLSYIQGPPGTGKTMTIVNTILTAFYNHRTVLLASYNNHPVNEAVAKLRSFHTGNALIPFPVIRLGSNEETINSLRQIRKLLKTVKNASNRQPKEIKNTKERMANAKKLSDFLDQYEERLELLERKDALKELLENSNQMNFSLQLETGQLPEIEKKLKESKNLNIKTALKYVNTDFGAMKEELYRMSIRCLRRLLSEEYDELIRIIHLKDTQKMVREFNEWLYDGDHMKKFLRVFPVVATTCISAHKLSFPMPVFDLVILDEASQCNTAVSLVPIIRGKSLMLVGDPQQLSPVIQLSQHDSDQLRKKYDVSEEYDYCTSSIYKTMLACDPVSDEVLLSHHYRCDPKIIGFNNRKYYGNKLKMDGKSESDTPLVYVDVPDNRTYVKNTAPGEAQAIISYLKENPDQNVGIITPFVRQKELIQKELEQNQIHNVSCGTVHAFQGDEKDVILFSLALTENSRPETYAWLKNNRELINVSTSRARQKLMLFTNTEVLERLHDPMEADDLYDLACYVRSGGAYVVSERSVESRALGIRPWSTETETAFMENLTLALDNAFADGSRYSVHKEVPVSQIFMNKDIQDDFFYRGRFDFVIFRRIQKNELPVLAIELDGMEHMEDSLVKERDAKKEAICRQHGFELIRVDNTYARRYHYIKEILIRYFRA